MNNPRMPLLSHERTSDAPNRRYGRSRVSGKPAPPWLSSAPSSRADAIAGFEAAHDPKAIADAMPSFAGCGSELGEGDAVVATVKQD
jgi:hypothetical protein